MNFLQYRTCSLEFAFLRMLSMFDFGTPACHNRKIHLLPVSIAIALQRNKISPALLAPEVLRVGHWKLDLGHQL